MFLLLTLLVVVFGGHLQGVFLLVFFVLLSFFLAPFLLFLSAPARKRQKWLGEMISHVSKNNKPPSQPRASPARLMVAPSPSARRETVATRTLHHRAPRVRARTGSSRTHGSGPPSAPCVLSNIPFSVVSSRDWGGPDCLLGTRGGSIKGAAMLSW